MSLVEFRSVVCQRKTWKKGSKTRRSKGLADDYLVQNEIPPFPTRHLQKSGQAIAGMMQDFTSREPGGFAFDSGDLQVEQEGILEGSRHAR